jgi:hypothetical protein
VLLYIQRQMGHASLETTINTYALIDDLGTRLVDLPCFGRDARQNPQVMIVPFEGGRQRNLTFLPCVPPQCAYNGLLMARL